MSGKRPPIPDDTVFFSIYTTATLPEDASEIQNQLENLRTECLSIISPLAKGYIWQHEPFDIAISRGSSRCTCSIPPQTLEEAENQSPSSSAADVSLPPHLHGKLKYGDNIEDEWFVVYLLFAISKRIPEVCIRVWDTDGEFILIEAAYSIPKWLKPENSWNRVFIRHGELHIIPLPSSPSEIYQLPLLLSIGDALKIFNSGSFNTKADESVQTVIKRRLSDYGEVSKKNMHNAVCRVPLSIAQILKHEPQLVSLAVEAFYDRDLDSMKAASKMEHFMPRDKEIEMVDVVITMSRAMYAQLTQQVFQAPRCYAMPPLSDPHYKEAELGMKLTCGFEMMYWERSRDIAKDAGLSKKDAGWQNFLSSLHKSGYFRDLLEGSKEYRELMEQAKSRYMQTTVFSRSRKAISAPIQRIEEILALPHSVSDFSRTEEMKGDDDSWLYDGEEDLKAAMLERQKEMDNYESKRSSRKKSIRKANELKGKKGKSDFDACEIAKTMHDFIDTISSYEGAELPDESGKGEDEPVTIRMENFLKELQSAFGANAEMSRWNGASSEEMEVSSSDEIDEDDSESDNGETMETEQLASEVLPSTSNATSLSKNNSDAFMEEYSEALDRELNTSTLGKTFVRVETKQDHKGGADNTEELPPVNIDMNLLQNLLESYSSQHGLPGPASNLLGSMGLHLPDDKDT